MPFRSMLGNNPFRPWVLAGQISNRSVNLIMSANIYQNDQVFPTRRVRLKSKDDATIVFHPASPQPFQLPAQFVGF